jgi:hypothetical protein
MSARIDFSSTLARGTAIVSFAGSFGCGFACGSAGSRGAVRCAKAGATKSPRTAITNRQDLNVKTRVPDFRMLVDPPRNVLSLIQVRCKIAEQKGTP